MTSPAELERLGLVAPPEEFALLPVTPVRSAVGNRYSRAMRTRSTARRPTAKARAPIAAGRILCGA